MKAEVTSQGDNVGRIHDLSCDEPPCKLPRLVSVDSVSCLNDDSVVSHLDDEVTSSSVLPPALDSHSAMFDFVSTPTCDWDVDLSRFQLPRLLRTVLHFSWCQFFSCTVPLFVVSLTPTCMY